MKVLDAVVHFYERQYIAALFILLALTVGAVLLARSLVLDADLEALLPSDAPSVEGLADLEQAYGHLGRLTVVLETTEERESVRELAEEIGAAIAGLDEVERVEVRRPVAFFEQNRLLYIRYDDLEEAAERVSRRIRHERGRANPLFADLGARDPPSLDLSDIEARYADVATNPYFESEDGRYLVVFVYPRFSAAELDRSEQLLHEVDALVQSVIDEHGLAVDHAYTGRYVKRVEQQALIAADLTRATLMAVMLLMVFLLLYLRSITAMVLVIVPLVVGTVWAFAWAALVFGELNVLTGFLGAILLGLGVDYGIHLVTRYFEYRSEGAEVGAALAMTLAQAGRASLFAGLTTMVALGSLAVSSFRAFYEFGVIALGGLALVLLAYGSVFPILVLAMSRMSLRARNPLSVVGARRGAAWLRSGPEQGRTRLRLLWRGSLIGLSLILLAGIVGLFNVELARDFRTLQTTDTMSWELDEVVNSILGQSQIPGVVLVASPDHARRVVEELRWRSEQWPQGYVIADVIGPGDALPYDQEAKLELLDEMREELLTVPEDERSEELREHLAEIEGLLERGVLRWDDLPESVRLPFERRDDPSGSVVLVFSEMPIEEADVIDAYAVIMRDLPGPVAHGLEGGDRIDGINDALMLADIIEFMRRDTQFMVMLTMLGLIVIGLIAFGPTRDFLWAMVALGLSLVCAVGLVGTLGLRFNFVNLIVLPVWLGLAVDASFHMYQRFYEEPHRIEPHLSVSGAVAAAFVTSMIGFGVLLIAHHDGLRSLGFVALTGLATILATNLLLQFVHIGRHQFRLDERQGSESGDEEGP
jgi:uncharacterized protein